MQLQKAHFNLTIDGQFGSTGKGIFNDYIAQTSQHKPDICITNAAPNAGHTYVDGDGTKKTVFHLPVSGVKCPDSQIYLCAGSIIDPEVLAKELSDFGIAPERVTIHPRACILLPEHREREAQNDSGATTIASTRKGVGAALADKVARTKGTRVAEQFYGKTEQIKALDLMDEMNKRKTCLMEVPQGYGLSINHGRSYPQCTSRDITVAQALNDAGVHPHYLGGVGLSLRSYPIRVGHIVDEHGEKIGDSGPFYPDSDEKSWADMEQEPELTTVTKRVRRIATFSFTQYKDALRMLRPNTIFLNFCNYFKDYNDFKEVVIRMSLMEDQVGLRPHYLFGYGPSANEIVEGGNLQHVWDTIKAGA